MGRVTVDYKMLQELCYSATNQQGATTLALDWAEKADKHIAELEARVEAWEKAARAVVETYLMDDDLDPILALEALIKESE